MHDYADRLAASVLSVEQELTREFEARLVESSTLAFRVAFGVLRHRQDAEDVAQGPSSGPTAASGSSATGIASAPGWCATDRITGETVKVDVTLSVAK